MLSGWEDPVASIDVYIAEDEPPIAAMLADMTEEAPGGFRAAFIAHDGRTMLEKLQRSRPALLLVDVRMPVMGGLELIEAAHRLYPDLPCAVVTSHTDFEYARSALRAGALDYILKSCLPESLHEFLLRAREKLGLGHPDGETNVAHRETGARLKEHLDKTLRGSFHLSEIAEAWGYNPLYLSRVFKDFVGISPKRYHTKAKIQLVMTMMKENRHLLLKEAAAIVHFEDELYLAKVFKKEVGMSFSEFRQKLNEERLS